MIGADLVDILVKATVVLALGLAASRLAAPARASVRHLLLAATFGALVVLPIAVATVPRIAVPVPASMSLFAHDLSRLALSVSKGERLAQDHAVAGRAAPGGSAFSEASADGRRATRGGWSTGSPRANSRSASADSAIAWQTLVASTWVLGVTALCGSLFLAFWRVRRIRRDGVPRPEIRRLAQSLAAQAGVRRSIDVLEHEQVAAPLTCGVWRPAIVLPVDAREWGAADLRRALVHELEHVRRGDWAIQVAARLVCGCYWFHPLAWVAWRGLCLEAERACDDAVARSEEPTDYADQLVLLARRLSHAHTPAMLGMANRSDLSTRVAALLDDRQRRGRPGGVAAIGVIVAAAAAVFTIAPVRALATSPRTVSEADAQTRRRDEPRRRARGLDRALYEAAENGDITEIDQLLQAGADVNCALDGDGSPLIAASRRRRFDIVRHLLDRGADVNMAVPGDGSPIIAAATEGAPAIVALLLDRGADIDRIVPEDENALIQASAHGRLEVVRLLIARGADVNARAWAESARERPGGEWRTPLGMARRGGHADVVAVLIAAGARE
jgi:beta-lactamase regulating signal transducer with metallopeptidase domain